MPRKNTPDARNRIMDAALRVFAEKTFEGARIEEIATAANVPKSLIYYHFKSKEDILKVLINDFLSEYKEIVNLSKGETSEEKANEIGNKLTNNYYDFAMKNADLIRLLFIDSLKKSKDKAVVFEIVKALVDAEDNSSKSDFTRNEKLISEFFTNILPNCMFICLGDAFTDYFNIDKKEFGDIFLRVIQLSHGAIHMNLERKE